jgi:hypothetical protein
LLATFEFSSSSGNPGPVLLHGEISTRDIDFVSNLNDQSTSEEAIFHIAGNQAELSYACTGMIEPTAHRNRKGRTHVPLNLASSQPISMVFQQQVEDSVELITPPQMSLIYSLYGD